MTCTPLKIISFSAQGEQQEILGSQITLFRAKVPDTFRGSNADPNLQYENSHSWRRYQNLL